MKIKGVTYRLRFERVVDSRSAVRVFVEFCERSRCKVFEQLDQSIALSNSPVSDSKVIEIERFFIKPKLRRVGHGRAIMHMLQLLYESRTFKVETPTPAGKSFYKKVGFSKGAAGELVLRSSVLQRAP